MKHFINSTLYELKQAYLSLKQKPLFVFSVVSTMGITLGALLCVLTLAYVMLIKPLPYPEQDRLYVSEHVAFGEKNDVKGVAFSYPGIVHLYQSKVAFEQAAMIYYGQDVITSHNNQPLVNTTYVTPEFHQMLASPIAVGRMFEASEGIDTNNPVAMLSYNTWQQEFAGSADILEQKINLSGVSYHIIGVLAKNFVEPDLADIGQKTQLWLPWEFNHVREETRQNFGNVNRILKFVGLLKEGIGQSQAQQLLTPLVNNRWQKGVADIAFFKGWSIKMRVRSVKNVIIGDSKTIAIMLLAGVIGLVLIASANISNLFMSRTAEKQRQMAIQAAIGANRKRLFKGVFAETSLLMLMSILLALVVAKIGFTIMQQYLAEILPRISELSFNLITLSSAALVTLTFAFFFAKLSVRMINYNALNTALQSSAKGSGLQVSKKTRQRLIASQVTLATVLVFANLGLLKDAVKTINVSIGFTTNNISTLTINFSSNGFPSQEQAIPTVSEIMEKIEALPQVELLSQGRTPLDGFGVRALTNIANNERYTPYIQRVDHKYFKMVEQPLLQGNNFTLEDIKDSHNVMIVNQAFAKQLKADGDVLGLQLSTGHPDPYKIIGIVKDITIPGDVPFGYDNATFSASVPRAYVPNRLSGLTFILKFKPEQSVSREQLVKLLAEVDSRYSIFSFNAADDTLTQSLFTEITTAITTAVLASLVFFLAGIGLYGVLNYGIQLRRFELGTRMAIGAKRKHLVSLVVHDNIKAVLVGFIGSGLLFALSYIGLSEYIQPYLNWQVLPMLFATLLLITLLTLFACYWPLRQYINKPAVHSLRGSE